MTLKNGSADLAQKRALEVWMNFAFKRISMKKDGGGGETDEEIYCAAKMRLFLLKTVI